MAQSSGPFENADTTESFYSWLVRNFSLAPGGGVQGVPGDTNLKVSAGTGMSTSLSAGQAMVRGHYYVNTSAITLTHDASTSNPRVDSIVLTLDPTANTITAGIVKGTPAASNPSAPALTQTDTGNYQLLLANVTIQASAINISSSDISDSRTFIKPVWTTGTRPPATLGVMGFNSTTGKAEFYDGSTWRNLPNEGDAVVASQISGAQQLTMNVGRVNGSKFSVQATQPTSPSAGDIWFW